MTFCHCVVSSCFYDVNYVYECLNKNFYKAVMLVIVLVVHTHTHANTHMYICAHTNTLALSLRRSLRLSEFITMSKIYLSSQMHVKCISRKLSHCLPSPPPTFPALSFPWLTSKAIQDMGRQQDAAPGGSCVAWNACLCNSSSRRNVCLFLFSCVAIPS